MARISNIPTTCAHIPSALKPLSRDSSNDACGASNTPQANDSRRAMVSAHSVLMLQNRCEATFDPRELDDVLKELATPEAGEHPALAAEVLFQIFTASPNLFEDLLVNAPRLKELLAKAAISPEPKLTLGCARHGNNKEANEKLSQYLDFLITKNGRLARTSIDGLLY